MMKRNRINFVLILFALILCMFAFVSMARADTCAQLFPGMGCNEGECDDYSSAGNCIIHDCWCDTFWDYVEYNCETGQTRPRCEEPI
jgi:hypothetical protein